MRIWLLTSEMPHEVAGGIARYVENFARLLGGAGHEVVIIARTEQACDAMLAPGVRLIGLVSRLAQLHEPWTTPHPDAHPAHPYPLLSYWPALSYQMAEEVLRLLQHLPRPDIIESQDYAALPYFLLQRKLTEQTLLTQIPIVVMLHGPVFELARVNQEPRFRFPQYWVGQMEKFCIAAADAIVAPTTFPVRAIECTLQRSLDVLTVPHPLMIHCEVAPDRASPRHIVCVGRLQVLKGTLSLLKECQRLWHTGVDFRLSLVGGDADFLPKETTVATFLRQRYAKWIESGHLTLAGQLDHDAVLESMQQAWAVVVPSLWESFSYTCMEAMAVGQVVLASRTGGQAEQIERDGVNGFLFDWESPGDFEQKFRAVLALTKQERLRIARNAHARIRAYCAPAPILQQRLQHYEQVIARHAPRSFFPTVNTLPEPPAQPRPVEDEQRGLLSIVVPFYNLGDYLPETIANLLATTYTPFEIIIVNDGSSDPRSLEVVRELESRQLPHLRIVQTRNQGLASARNTGAEAARGEFVAFVDADDLVEPDFFSRAIVVLQRYSNVAVVYSWLRYFGEAADLWPAWNAEFPYLLGHNLIAVLAVLRRTTFLHCARHKPEFEYNFEDYETWVTLLEAGGVGVSLPYPLARYRVRSGSLYRQGDRNQFLYLHELVTRYHPRGYQDWGVELFNLQNANGPGRMWNQPAQEVVEPSQAYVASLEHQRDTLWANVQTLGKLWHDQVRFIEAQRVYIGTLEKRCHELDAVWHGNAPLPLPLNGPPIAWRDYELGGRVVNRLRRTWLARQVSQSPLLKKVVRSTLKKGRAFFGRGQ